MITISTPQTAGVTQPMPIAYVERNSAGIVTMSPIAVIVGVATLSRSQLYALAASARTTAIAPTSKLESTPPNTEMTTRSTTSIVAMPSAIATPFASRAKSSDTENVRTVAAYMFWKRTPSRFDVASNMPVWMLVPSRDDNAPKMLPRIELAAGSSMSRPGSFASVPVIAASAMPAAISPTVETTSETRPWRIVRRSALQ